MFKTEDNYNLYFDGRVSQNHEANFKKLIQKNQLDPELVNLPGRQHNVRIYDSYKHHRVLLWALYEVLGPYAITIFFAEVEHPHGCEYQCRVDFYVGVNKRYDYELKNSLFLHEDHRLSDECKRRVEKKSFGFDPDCRHKGDMSGLNMEAFVKSVM